VLIDHQGIDESGPSVEATHSSGGYLIELGNRRIGFLTGTLDLRCSTDRLASYRGALAEFGLPDETAARPTCSRVGAVVCSSSMRRYDLRPCKS
jgi:DNA-binding LacI/PurR family transcriptional regulator